MYTPLAVLTAAGDPAAPPAHAWTQRKMKLFSLTRGPTQSQDKPAHALGSRSAAADVAHCEVQRAETFPQFG